MVGRKLVGRRRTHWQVMELLLLLLLLMAQLRGRGTHLLPMVTRQRGLDRGGIERRHHC